MDVTVTYKDVKHLRMRVRATDARVLITAPMCVSQAEVYNFAEGNVAWIHEAKRRVREHSGQLDPLTDNSQVRLRGQWYDLRVSYGYRAHASFDGSRIAITASDDAGRRRALDKLYQRELRPRAVALIRLWEPRIGRTHTQLKLRRMTTRWGTCNTLTGVITLNTALARYRDEALEYVVVHELVHLLERGHGPAFQARMNRLLPDWRERRRALRSTP